MRRTIQLGLLLSLAAVQLPATEMANLRNGFSIRHEHHEVVGANTRLYISNEPDGSYVDVLTSEIESFAVAPPDVTNSPATPAKQVDLATIIGDASARSRIDADFIASVIRAESGNNCLLYTSPSPRDGLLSRM